MAKSHVCMACSVDQQKDKRTELVPELLKIFNAENGDGTYLAT